MNTDTMGAYGNYYLKRAIVAMIGLGANQPDDAVYPLLISDSEGQKFIGLLNTLVPVGRLVVVSRVVEVTPNVAGQVIAFPAIPNVQLKAGDILFEIDPQPFKTKLAAAEATLAQAKQQAAQLQAAHDQALASVEGLTRQLAYQTQRLANVQKLATQGARA